MEISEMVISLVIIGILNLTSAQASIPVKDGSSVKIPGHDKIRDIDTSNMINEVGKWIEEKCEKNRGSAKNVPKYFLNCVRSLKTDEETFPHEITVNETVVKKFCNVVPGIETCMKNITVALTPCLETEEKGSIDILLNVTNSLMEFICMKEGEDLAKFIAADGVDCVMSKQPEIKACANKTFGQYIMAIQSASSNFSLLSLLDVDLEKCMGIENFRRCVVPVLKTCDDPPSSVSVDSVFNHLRKITPCDELFSEQEALLPAAPQASVFGLDLPWLVERVVPAKIRAASCLWEDHQKVLDCIRRIPCSLGGCRKVETVKDCVIKLVDQCDATFIKPHVDSVYKAINHAIQCDLPGAVEILRCGMPPRSHASSAGVVSVALMIVAVAISL